MPSPPPPLLLLPHQLYTVLSFATLFCAAWYLTPFAAASIAQQFDPAEKNDTGAALIRLRARKQLQLQLWRRMGFSSVDTNEQKNATTTRPATQRRSVKLFSMQWLRRLRLEVMVP